jgi:hypothetical protein
MPPPDAALLGTTTSRRRRIGLRDGVPVDGRRGAHLPNPRPGSGKGGAHCVSDGRVSTIPALPKSAKPIGALQTITSAARPPVLA